MPEWVTWLLIGIFGGLGSGLALAATRYQHRLRRIADKTAELLAEHERCHRERALLRSMLRHGCVSCGTGPVDARHRAFNAYRGEN